MKILVIQLARLGDIYQSWPMLRALRRQYSEADIHILTRDRFKDALVGLGIGEKIHILPTKEILSPMILKEDGIQDSFKQVSNFIESLKAQDFDWIINLSFSPLSSYLTHAIEKANTKTSGYTRQSDGYLRIPDDMSAYFYAQVGVSRPNRYHLAEIFGTLAEVDLIPADWSMPKISSVNKVGNLKNSVVIHIGASEHRKALSPEKWIAILSHFFKVQNNWHATLVGSKAERYLSDKITASLPLARVTDLVGETNIPELVQVVANAKLLVGCDSAPIHIASLTNTPTLNLSLSTVNFWETGPRAKKSFILKADTEQDLLADDVANVMFKILCEEKLDIHVISGVSGTPSYYALSTKESDFQWKLVQAIYTGSEFPQPIHENFYDGVEKLEDVNNLLLEQIGLIKAGTSLDKVSAVLDRAEEIIQAISQLVPDLSPLIRWYQTEKLRIGPGDQGQVLRRTEEIHTLLGKVLQVWRKDEQVSIEST